MQFPKIPDYITFSIPIFFLLIGVELLVARRLKLNLYRFNDSVSDLSAGIFSQVVGAFSRLFFLGLYILIYENLRLEVLFPNAGWAALTSLPVFASKLTGLGSSVAVFVLCFVLYDHQYYWFHRKSHEVNVIWGSHIAHHSSEEYNLSVALRQGGFQGFFSFIFYVPLALVGFNPITFFVAGQFVTLYQFWIHTRALDKMPRWFEAIFNTPSHHRVHHGRNPQYIDRNHAGTFIIWDKLYGSFEPEGEEVVYGITNPLNTWNPIWAQFHYWIELYQLARRAPRWRDRVLVWFKEPGWMPEGLGPHKTAPKVRPETYHKFGFNLPDRMNLYVLVQFLFVIAGLLFVSLTIANPAVTAIHRLAAAAFVVGTMLNLGLILDLRPYVFAWEAMRLITMAALVAVYVFETGDVGTGSFAAGIFAALLGWWVQYRRHFTAGAIRRLQTAG